MLVDDDAAVMSEHDLDAARTRHACAQLPRGRDRRNCWRRDDRLHKRRLRLPRRGRLEGAAPQNQHGSGDVVPTCRGSYQPRPRHALEDDPNLLVFAPAPPTPGLDDLQPIQRSERMTVHTRCSQRDSSYPTRRSPPDGYGRNACSVGKSGRGARDRVCAYASLRPELAASSRSAFTPLSEEASVAFKAARSGSGATMRKKFNSGRLKEPRLRGLNHIAYLLFGSMIAKRSLYADL